MRKTQKLRRGGARSAENQAKLNAKYNIVKANLQKVKTMNVASENNFKYNNIKKTIIPQGKQFYFRSQVPSYDLKDEPMWFDYSVATTEHTYFLNHPLQDYRRFSKEFYNSMIEQYGKYIIEVIVKKPLTVIHFPVDYTSQEASQGPHSYSAFFEEVVKKACLESKELCADGYTIDIFYKEDKWIPGFRNIYIFNPNEHLEVIRIMSPVDQDLIYKMGDFYKRKFETLKENLKKIQDIPNSVFDQENDLDYRKIKKSRVPVGKHFYFRSTKPIYDLEDRPLWMDYSGSVNKESFILGNQGKLPESLISGFRKRFGDYVMEVEVIKPMTILHFPVFYDSEEASIANGSYSQYAEPIILKACARKKIPNGNNGVDYTKACGDGYTLDIFYRPMGIRYKQNWVPGYRELCVYHPQDKLKIVNVYES